MHWAPKETKEELDEFKIVAEFMKKLNIKFTPINPYREECFDNMAIDGNVSLIQLYELFNNEDKFKELVSKLKLKTFW